MDFIASFRKAIAEIQTTEGLSTRLSIAADRLEDSESKIATLQTQIGNLEARLEQATMDRNQIRDKYERLQKEHEDEIVFERGIEFRRGKTTRGRWMPFCPKCHQPVISDSMESIAYCSSRHTCKSIINVISVDLGSILEDLNT
jgi:hypothetical protein